MFEKFGELNSFGEINELAENLFNEGDTESLRAMAKENGIQSDFVDMYLQGEIPVLCDQLVVLEEQEFAESKRDGNAPVPQPADAGDGFMNIPDGIEDNIPFN